MVVNDRLRKGSRPRRSTKILRCALYFQLSSRCLIWWLNTSASHALCISSHLILAWKVLGLFFTTCFFLKGEGGRALETSEPWQKWILCYIILRLAMELFRPGVFVSLVGQGPHPCSIYIYKKTKKVSALWLAERSVCRRVCQQIGCGVKMFCYSRANHASTNLKKFSSSKLDKFTLFTHSSVGWNLENRYKEGMSIFFA